MRVCEREKEMGERDGEKMGAAFRQIKTSIYIATVTMTAAFNSVNYSYISGSAVCTVLSSASDSVELLDIDLLLNRGRSTDFIELLWLPGRDIERE